MTVRRRIVRARTVSGAVLLLLVTLLAGVPSSGYADSTDPGIVVGTLTASGDIADTKKKSQLLRRSLTEELSSKKGLRVLDRSQYAALMAERETSPFQQSSSLSSRLSGADYLLSGSLIPLETDWLITLQLIEVETGKIVETVSRRSTGLTQAGAPLVKQLLERIKETNLAKLRREQTKFTYKPQIRLYYLRGLRYFHMGKYYRSLSQFMRARDLGFETPVLSFWMGRAYYQLDKKNHARLELEGFLEGVSDHPYEAFTRDLLSTL